MDSETSEKARDLLHRLSVMQPPNVILQQITMLGEACDILAAALATPPAAPDEAMARDAMRWQAYRESKQTLYFLGAATPDEADAIVDSLMAAKLPIPSHRDELTAALTGDKA